MKNHTINVTNVTLSSIVFVAAVASIVALTKYDQNKDTLLTRSDDLARAVTELTNHYDVMLKKNYAQKVNPVNIDQGNNLDAIRERLQTLDIQQKDFEEYHTLLVDAVKNLVSNLELPDYATRPQMEALTERLNSFDQYAAALSEVKDAVRRLRERDDLVAQSITELSEKLKLEIDAENLNGLDNQCDVVFGQITGKLAVLRNNRSALEESLGRVAQSLGVNETFANESNADLNRKIAALKSEVSSQKSKLASCISDNEAHRADLAERDATIEELKADKSEGEETLAAREDDRAQIGANIWKRYDPNPEICSLKEMFGPDSYYAIYSRVNGSVLNYNPQWQMVQINCGRNCVVQQNIGDKGITQKMRAPILPNFRMRIVRPTVINGIETEKDIAIINIFRVDEFSSVGNVVWTPEGDFNAPLKFEPTDVVKYDAETLKQLDSYCKKISSASSVANQ